MKIGVIGTGNMGSGLSRGLARAGHDVVVGSRDEARARATADAIGAGAGTYAEATSHGEVIVLAVPWWSIDSVLPALGDVTGKILLDCTNPFVDNTGSLQRLHETSAAEEIARQTPGARVVKCFNHIVAEVIHLDRPEMDPPAAAFLCGDDPEAKLVAGTLARDFGYDPVDVGGLDAARMLEQVAGLVMRITSGGIVPSDRVLALLPGTGSRR